MSMRLASSHLLLAAGLGLAASSPSLLIVGCGAPGSSAADMTQSSTCAAETRADAYAAGIQHASATKLYNVTLVTSTPGPPQKGDNTWLVRVADAGGAAVDGATVAVNPTMPDHGHGTPIKVVVTPMGGGQYQLTPLNLFMSGLWRIEINITTMKGADQAAFQFCIEG